MCIIPLNLLLHFRRTGIPLNIKARKDSNGFENVDDYFPDSGKSCDIQCLLNYVDKLITSHNLLFCSIQLYGKIINEQCHRLVRLNYGFTVLNLGPIHFCQLMRTKMVVMDKIIICFTCECNLNKIEPCICSHRDISGSSELYINSMMHIYDEFCIYLKQISEFIRFSPLIFHLQSPNV